MTGNHTHSSFAIRKAGKKVQGEMITRKKYRNPEAFIDNK
jgi:hypothetical protein